MLRVPPSSSRRGYDPRLSYVVLQPERTLVSAPDRGIANRAIYPHRCECCSFLGYRRAACRDRGTSRIGRPRVLRPSPQYEILSDTRTQSYGKRHTPHQSNALFSPVFDKRMRGASLTTENIPAHGIADTPSPRHTRSADLVLRADRQRAVLTQRMERPLDKSQSAIGAQARIPIRSQSTPVLLRSGVIVSREHPAKVPTRPRFAFRFTIDRKHTGFSYRWFDVVGTDDNINMLRIFRIA